MKRQMKITDWAHVIAGAFIIISLALGTWAHPYWYFFNALVSPNLFQFGFTRFFPVGLLLKKMAVTDDHG